MSITSHGQKELNEICTLAKRAGYTVYMHSATAPVKVQISADKTNWVDVFTQSVAGNSVYTLNHNATHLRIVAASGSPTGTFHLVPGHIY